MKNMIYISIMNITDLDLNLLRVFDAIATEGSVTIAGERVGLSQPAMSNALARLRQLFDDPLFVRTPRGMRPTPFALQLAQPVRESLRLIQGALAQHAGFDPRSSGTTFRFYMSDIGEMVFLPDLLERVKRDAPGVRIEVVRIPIKEVHAALESGELDLAVGFLPGLTKGMRAQTLFREHYVCMLRADHPLTGAGISAKQFRAASHVLVSYAGTGHQVIEETFVRERLSARIAARVPHFLVVPMILARTDLIVTVPSRVAAVFAGLGSFKVLKLPLHMPSFEVRLHWHQRFHQDPANRWLREMMAELYAEQA
ncbi:MAG: LysR family transcriptional regulator [Betaproteobacteria bacterium]|nr:MAG: LysR family transcriptional regulator [Betaproteobacteria bacterium]